MADEITVSSAPPDAPPPETDPNATATRAEGALAVSAHIRADINTQYKCVGAAVITMQQAGFQRVGFISEPPPLAGVRVE